MADKTTVVTFGESVAWGQGLLHDQKCPSIIHETLSDRPCGPLDRDLIKARSGAVIEDASQSTLSRDITRWGRHEVPRGAPSVTEQVTSYPEADDPPPETVDVVVVAGGINDVGVNTILNPRTGYDLLRRNTERHLYGTVRDLLERIIGTFSDAEVLVLGYYPLLTYESEPPPLEELGNVLGLEDLTPAAIPVVSKFWTRVAENAEFFHRHQLWMLTRVVADVSAANPDAAVRFVHPGFSPENGIWADRAMMFAPEEDDPARNVRLPACIRVHGEKSAFSGTVLQALFNSGLVRCKVASTGHPDPAGARRYAETALRRRNHHRTISLRALLTEVLGASGEPLATDDILERYGFDGADGIRSLAALRELDCLTVRIASEVVELEIELDVIPDAITQLPMWGVQDFIRHVDDTITLLELDLDSDLVRFGIHNWVGEEALATLEAHLAGGRTVTRRFDNRGYGPGSGPVQTPASQPFPGSSRTDVAILDPMFDEPHDRLPLGALEELRVRMADFERQAFERLLKPAFGRMGIPNALVELIDLDRFLSAVWRIKGVAIDVDGHQVHRDDAGWTLETDEERSLGYPG